MRRRHFATRSNIKLFVPEESLSRGEIINVNRKKKYFFFNAHMAYLFEKYEAELYFNNKCMCAFM